MRLAAVIGVVLLFAVAYTALTPDPVGRVVYRCSDFQTRAEAERMLHEGHYNLDRDNDGTPCEALP